MSEMDQILEGLIRQTDDGKLRWRPSVTKDTFVTSVDAIAVVVRELSTGKYFAPARHQLEIFNDEGHTAEVLETSYKFAAVPNESDAAHEQALRLRHLHQLARRSALNTQATLAKLAKALEA